MIWYAAAVLLILAAFVLRLGLLAYALYTIAGLILISRYLTRVWGDSLQGKRELSRTEADIGERVVVNLQVTNRSGWWIPWVLIEDLAPREAVLHDRLKYDGRRVALVMLAPQATKNVNYSFTPQRRGYYQIGPLVLETGDLFGLQRRFLLAAEPQYVLVLPKVVPLTGYSIASRRPIGEVRMSYRLFEDPTRIAGVRQYEPGDPLNRVNWQATARTGLLHSKVYEPSTIAGATLVVDFHSAAHDRKHEPRRSELAVTAAASIAHALYLMGQQIGLVTNGRDAADRIRQEGFQTDARTRNETRRAAAAAMVATSDRLAPVMVPTEKGAEQLTRILEALARLELTDGLDLPSLLLETSPRLSRDATVIVILPRVRPEDAIALGLLKRRGFTVVAILNLHDEFDYSTAAGPLLALGIETRHLRDESSVAEICGRQQGVAFV